jgi:hypothetical protein
MTPAERAVKRGAWLSRIRKEIERREAPTLGAAGGDVRKQFLEELRVISERLLAAPDWREPSPSEKRRYGQQVDRWFREHGYGTGGGG